MIEIKVLKIEISSQYTRKKISICLIRGRMSISLYCNNISGYRGGDRCHPTPTHKRGAWQLQEIRAVRAWRLRDTLFPPFDWSACSQCTSTGSDAFSLLI